MPYRTINIYPETYERLLLYKHAGMSFNDVLDTILDMIPEELFYQHILDEHRQRMEKIKAGEYVEATDLDQALTNS